jgi:hypothetical protein
MFYTKSKLLCGRTVRAEINDENVFTRCAECGCELPVDIVEIFSDDLFFTDIVCSRCTMKKRSAHTKGLDDIKVPLMYDGIVWLEFILARSGYGNEILKLYDRFLIDDVDDLRPDQYAAFGNALAKMAVGAVED